MAQSLRLQKGHHVQVMDLSLGPGFALDHVMLDNLFAPPTMPHFPDVQN